MRTIMSTIMSIFITLCIYLGTLLILRKIGMEAEVFDFVGRMAFILGLIFTIQPDVDMLNRDRE